jgi:hypothetical protein
LDIFSHALWGFWIIRWRKEALWGAFFGVLPDILTFLPLTVYLRLAYPELHYMKPPLELTPAFFLTIYNTMHSLVTWSAVFFLVWWLAGKKIFYPLFAWLLHICMDIPTHSGNYYPTKFLYPLTNFYINGISCGRWEILLPDATALVAVYAWYFYRKSSKNVQRTHHR